jgi:hypothetical protein
MTDLTTTTRKISKKSKCEKTCVRLKELQKKATNNKRDQKKHVTEMNALSSYQQ